ncbi:MAG: ABC transporter permease [Candidatus Amulumruptor caecigallinarius]|nr:ABC transporter permease [Candidatus Amulumruptor caecigallinarius]
MFFHNFKYSLKILFKNKMLIFWTFAFPILLALFFNMAFSGIEKGEVLDIIDIAVINNQIFENDETFKEAFNTLSSDTENKIFNISYVDLDEALEMLNENKITGYVELKDENVNIMVKSTGINETILRYVVEEISSNKKIVSDLALQEIEKYGNSNIDYAKIYSSINELVNSNTVNLNNVSNKNLSYTMVEYYSLIAMSCLYGGLLSMFIINYKLANMNSVGKRTAISPIHKGKMLLGSLLASYITQLIGISLLFIFTVIFLHVDYGSNLSLIILLTCCGSFAGLTMGVLIATVFKTNENAKTGILIAITMSCSFLSGMMGVGMKYVIDKNVPIINIINPANMITDGLYSLYYYDTLDRYIFNIVSLIIFSIILTIISYVQLRREKYDSI